MRIAFDLTRFTDDTIRLWLRLIEEVFGLADGTLGYWLAAAMTTELNLREQNRKGGTKRKAPKVLYLTVCPGEKQMAFDLHCLGEIFGQMGAWAALANQRAEKEQEKQRLAEAEQDGAKAEKHRAAAAENLESREQLKLGSEFALRIVAALHAVRDAGQLGSSALN